MYVEASRAYYGWIKSRTRVTFDKLGKVTRTTLIDNFIKSVDPAEKKFVLNQSSPVPILMVQKVRSEAEKKEESSIRNLNTEVHALLVRPTESKPKHTMAGRIVVLKATFETSVLL